MKRQILCLLVLLLVSLCGLMTSGAQEDMTAVDNTVFGKPQRTRAVFRHDAHNEKAKIDDCSVCHHVYQDGKLVKDASSEGQPCADCHALAATGNTPSLRKAFHLRCAGCHEKSGKGPLMCGECHPKAAVK